VDATLVTAHSDKEGAAATFKRGYGHHPLWSFVDHGPDGTGEPLSVLLRPGNAGSNTAADHITVVREALRQLPAHQAGTRPGRKVLIRIDGAGATHELLNWIVGQRMSYSVGFTLPTDFAEQLAKIPKKLWTPAYNSDGEIRDGAWVAEVTGLLSLDSWPTGIRVSPAENDPTPERSCGSLTPTACASPRSPPTPHPAAPAVSWPIWSSVIAAGPGPEDRIRCAKDTGLTNLPLHDLDQNRIWCALVALACEITAWTQMLALAQHPGRRWEPKRLRLRLFSVAGRLARSGRRTVLHLAEHAPWAALVIDALTTLRALAEPG
jgi:hypothetical protein